MPILVDPPPIVRQLSADDLGTGTLVDAKALIRAGHDEDFKKMILTPLGINQGRELRDDSVIYTTRQIEGQKSPAAVSATREIDLNGDGKVTVGELQRYAFAADRIGDKDGKLTVGEYNRLFSVGQQRHLLEVGRRSGLSPESLKLLENRFASGKFSLSGLRGLPDALDLVQKSNDPVVTAQKTVAFIGLFEQGLQQVPEGARKDLSAVVLEHLAKTGITLAPIEKDEQGRLILSRKRTHPPQFSSS